MAIFEGYHTRAGRMASELVIVLRVVTVGSLIPEELNEAISDIDVFMFD